MGCVPGTLAGVLRGSVLLFVGILTDSRDTRQLGRQVIAGGEPQDDRSSLNDEPLDSESMKRELVQWKEELIRCKHEGSSASVARLEEQLAKREAELREMEDKHRRLEEEARNYPRPAYLSSAGLEDGASNVAVAGCSGVGKSLLVNSMRQVRCGDPAHAPVGTKHTTKAPAAYDLPGEAPVQLWDLPGAGSKAYARETYARDVGLRHFDVVLLIAGSRFTQTDAELLRGLREQGVPTLVVRTMVDLDIAGGRADLGQTDQETMQRILSDLKAKGISSPYLVNARKRDEHDFQKMMADLQKAIAVARVSPRRVPCRTNEDESRSQREVFEAGDAAEVVVLKGPQAGSWARCTITGAGTAPDCYAISLPDAPAEKRNLPNVHISALRRSQALPAQQDPQLLDLETVMEILRSFRQASGKPDIQTTLAAMDRQGPGSHSFRQMKQNFITETLERALSGMDLPVPKEVSPRLMECIQSHRSDDSVRKIAHEIESQLNLDIGELFGIQPRVGGKGALLALRGVDVREVYQVARRLGSSWQMLCLMFGCGFFDLISLATFPGALFQSVLLVLGTYCHFQHSRLGPGGRLGKIVVPLFYATGSALACLVACRSVQGYGDDLLVRLPMSVTEPSDTARRAIETSGALGVAAYILVAGSSSSLPSILHVSRTGCRTSTLTVVVCLVGAVRLLIELEVLLVLRPWILCVIPFAQDGAAAQGSLTMPAKSAILQRLVTGKAAIESFVRSDRMPTLLLMVALILLSMVSATGSYTLHSVAAPLKYALYYLHAVEDAPSKLSLLMSVPAIDGAATAAGAAFIHLTARLRGDQAVAHLIPAAGWEVAKGTVERFGSLGVGSSALLCGSSLVDPLLAAWAGTLGCSILLAPVAIFVAVTLRSTLLLEGGLAAVKGLHELTVPLEHNE